MPHEFLNSKPLEVFVILAETLGGWQHPSTETGKKVLEKHYEWGANLKNNHVLLLAGPLPMKEMNTEPMGIITGIIMLNVSTRKEAENWAFQDPFHVYGHRKNVVHSMKITATNNVLFPILDQLIKTK
jgi:uncharacterized protein YciI